MKFYLKKKEGITTYKKIEGCNQQVLVYNPNGKCRWNYEVLIPDEPLTIYLEGYSETTEAVFKEAFQRMETARKKGAQMIPI